MRLQQKKKKKNGCFELFFTYATHMGKDGETSLGI